MHLDAVMPTDRFRNGIYSAETVISLTCDLYLCEQWLTVVNISDKHCGQQGRLSLGTTISSVNMVQEAEKGKVCFTFMILCVYGALLKQQCVLMGSDTL